MEEMSRSGGVQSVPALSGHSVLPAQQCVVHQPESPPSCFRLFIRVPHTDRTD